MGLHVRKPLQLRNGANVPTNTNSRAQSKKRRSPVFESKVTGVRHFESVPLLWLCHASGLTQTWLAQTFRMNSRPLVCLMSLFMTALLVWAQAETGQITGTDTDASGGVIAKAAVEIKNVATGAVRATTTNSNGAYTIPNLLPGTYTVTV